MVSIVTEQMSDMLVTMLSNGRFELDPISEEEEGPTLGPHHPPGSLIAQITLVADVLAKQQQQQLDVPIEEEPIIPQLPVQVEKFAADQVETAVAKAHTEHDHPMITP